MASFWVKLLKQARKWVEKVKHFTVLSAEYPNPSAHSVNDRKRWKKQTWAVDLSTPPARLGSDGEFAHEYGGRPWAFWRCTVIPKVFLLEIKISITLKKNFYEVVNFQSKYEPFKSWISPWQQIGSLLSYRWRNNFCKDQFYDRVYSVHFT